jgi:hypothetical protein
MLRFKHFNGAGQELEESINEWLAAFEPEVSQMVQTVDRGGLVTIGFLFEESFRGQERRMSEEARPRSRVEAPIRKEDAPLKVGLVPD